MRIVLGLDGSNGATTALRWAVHEAGLHGASVEALFAGAGDDLAAAEAALRAWLDRARTDLPVIPSVTSAAAAPALIEVSADVDLVVVGSRGLGGFRELLLGSVGAAVAERAACPVAVVRETGHHPLGPVVTGVDGSASSLDALRWAADEARARNVPLEIVHAWSGMPAPVLGLPTVLPLSHLEEAAEHQLTEVMGQVDLGGLVVHRHVVESTPAGALVRLSERAALVVVGTRGHGGVTAAFLGSTSRHLLHHAHCPVVVVR